MSDPTNDTRKYSPRASLAAIGVKLRAIDLLGPIKELVKIPQKTVNYSPIEKLEQAFITILAGAKGMVEINTRLRSDQALQRAFGLKGCAEQSTVQETLSAATEINVTEMEQAVARIYQTYSLANRHNYQAGYQLLDLDFTGLPCGPKAEASKKGYFDKEIRYGRQLGRVIAVHYEEIVIDRIYAGNVQLQQKLQELMMATEARLNLTEQLRARTLVRFDSGGGSYEDINWLLSRGYKIHCREYSSRRVANAASAVTQWVDDTKVAGRQFGWLPPTAKIDNVYSYGYPVRRLISRQPKKEGGYRYSTMLISNLAPKEVITLMKLPIDTLTDEAAVTRAYAHFYDQRSGGIEIEIKEDKQGIGLTKRSKKKFAAQQMIMLLGMLAHNVLVWMRHWLTPHAPKLSGYGIMRWVRDILSISGLVKWDRRGFIIAISLDNSYRISYQLVQALGKLLPGGIKIILGIN